jgi:hypothetical protein
MASISQVQTVLAQPFGEIETRLGSENVPIALVEETVARGHGRAERTPDRVFSIFVRHPGPLHWIFSKVDKRFDQVGNGAVS